jgi:hypothetical protein
MKFCHKFHHKLVFETFWPKCGFIKSIPGQPDPDPRGPGDQVQGSGRHSSPERTEAPDSGRSFP